MSEQDMDNNHEHEEHLDPDIEDGDDDGGDLNASPGTNDDAEPVNIGDMMKRSFLEYADAVNSGRALADVRDGLKPVHRRIIFAASALGAEWNKAYKKSARIVGDVIGKYHPHGDTAVYDAAVRMAQLFSMRYLLIDGQGNFGNIDGDSAAAMRYTEMRLTRLCGEMVRDLKYDTVAFEPNYDGTETEPSVLPTPFPNLIVNGTEGIAVGLGAYVPPHNLRDVVQLTLRLMDDPEAPTSELLQLMGAPDFPTGGILYNLGGMVTAMEEGRGRMNLRAKWHEEPRGRGASNIVIDELPYQVNKSELVVKISELVADKIVEDIVDLRDNSNKKGGIRVVIGVRAGTSAEAVFSQLCRLTNLDTSIHYDCNVLVDGWPVRRGIRHMLLDWIRFRKSVIAARIRYELKQARTRQHLLRGFLQALNRLDETIAYIRSASAVSDARAGLMTLLSIDEVQSQAILDLRLQKITGMEIEGIRNESIHIDGEIVRMNAILSDDSAIIAIAKVELQGIADRYGDERRTEVNHALGQMDTADFITVEDVLISVTRKGYVKRVSADSLSTQNRGTKGRKLLTVDDDDEVSYVYHCNSHDLLMVMGVSGTVYGIKAYQIPDASIGGGRGRHIRNVVDGLEEEIVAVLTVPENDASAALMTVTVNGYVKRTPIASYRNMTRRGGLRGLGIKEGDALLTAAITRPGDHILITASTGKAIRFETDSVRAMGRDTEGVIGIRLPAGAQVVGAYVVSANLSPEAIAARGEAVPDADSAASSDDAVGEATSESEGSAAEAAYDLSMNDGKYLVCIGAKGVGKRTAVGLFPVQKRAGLGVIAFNVIGKTGNLVAATGMEQGMDIILFADNGVTNRIRFEDIPDTGRATSGARLMMVDESVSVTRVTTALTELAAE